MLTKKHLCWLLLSICSFSSHAAKEFQLGDESYLRLSAFGTFGLTASSIERTDPTLIRDKQDVSGVNQGELPFLADSRLGIQMDAILSPKFSAVVQFLIKDRLKQDLPSALQWAFVKYQPDTAWQFRAGRMGGDSFMLSDQRNVGFTYLWVRPPIEFYGYFPVYNYDGGDMRYRIPFFDGKLDFKAFVGHSTNIFPMGNGDYTHGDMSPIWGGNVIFSNNEWQIRASYVHANMDNQLKGFIQLKAGLNAATPFYPDGKRLADGLVTKDKQAQYISAGVAYDHNDWQIQAEVADTITESPILPDIYNGYLSVGHHFGEFTPYVMYSRLATVKRMSNAAPSAIPQLQPLIEGTNRALKNLNNNQETFSFGTRWDFYENMALKLQYDRTYVMQGGYGLWMNTNNTEPKANDAFNVFSLTFDFVY